jgi:fumarate reductase flavoprotein subunit
MDNLARRTPSDSVSETVRTSDVNFDVDTDILIAGGGGTGLVAALAASENPNIRVTLLEKDSECGGNTSLSTGMIPAAGTRLQHEAGIEDTPNNMARDILEKNDFTADEARIQYLCEQSANLIHWLVDDWNISLSIVDDFKYPKHSEFRMHAPPGRNGSNLIKELVQRVEATENIELLMNAPITKLVAERGTVHGVIAGIHRDEAIRAEKVILATDGFAGNRKMVTEYCEEEVKRALYFGTDGNTGDGIRLGAELGGNLACMDAYQGHATVAQRTGSLSTYAVVMNGGILVNENGNRFGDESAGYSEFAIDVLRQPNGSGYEFFDERIFKKLSGEFDDFDEAAHQGAYYCEDTVEDLATELGCDPKSSANAVEQYNKAVREGHPDQTGRVDGVHVLESPFYGTKVTGALFHTQGGLVVDEYGRVLRNDDSVVENLYAGGGTACGISGHGAGGYLSGNGLTTALGYGRLAGIDARESL